MKPTTISGLLAALCSATTVLADALHAAQTVTITSAPATTPPPELMDSEADPHLEIRQNNVQNPAATINPSQVPSITTQWIQSTIGSSTTYVEVIYTQTFAAVPDQLPSPKSGSIGYGTLKRTGGASNSKRDVEARETGLTYAYAQPVILVLENVAVTQYVQPVKEVVVLRTVTVTQNGTYVGNATFAGNATSANSTNTNANISITSTIGSFTAQAYNYTSPAGIGTSTNTNANISITSTIGSFTAQAYNYTSPAGIGTSTTGLFYFF